MEEAAMNGATIQEEEGLLCMRAEAKSILLRIWEWIFGIDLEREDECVRKACDLARKREQEVHEAANRDLDRMFDSLKCIKDDTEKFSAWQNWWMRDLEEIQRHDKKLADIRDIENRLYLYNYVMSDPFFVRPLARSAMEKIRSGEPFDV